MLRTIITVVAALAALQACTKPAVDTTPKITVQQQTEDAHKAKCVAGALEQLKDPDSAKITDMTRLGVKEVELAGGTRGARVLYEFNLNAKNSFGGYAGKTLWQCVFMPDEKEFKGVYPLS